MSVTLNRLTSVTPSWWKKVQWIFGVISVILGSSLPVLMTMDELPTIVTKLVELALAVSLAIVGMAQFTTSDKILSEK